MSKIYIDFMVAQQISYFMKWFQYLLQRNVRKNISRRMYELFVSHLFSNFIYLRDYKQCSHDIWEDFISVLKLSSLLFPEPQYFSKVFCNFDFITEKTINVLYVMLSGFFFFPLIPVSNCFN